MAFLKDSTLSKYIHNIKHSPRSLIANHHLLLTSALFACCGIPICWDQGSSSTIPSLPGFQKEFGITSATNPAQVADFISLVYIGAGVGSGLSVFLNDRVGRLWSLRIYAFFWIVAQLIIVGSQGNVTTLYAGRIFAGFAWGPLTVVGPVSLVEIAPTEIRGLLTTWFSVVMLSSLVTAAFTVYGVKVHMGATTLQWQIPFFLPCIIMAFVILASFFVQESPRWLFLVGRDEEGTKALVTLRGLPVDHPRVTSELEAIHESIAKEREASGSAPTYSFRGLRAICKETFLVKRNLRRTQQACISYALAQLSGANTVTTYLVPILGLVGLTGDANYRLFVAGMYSMSKLFYTIIASFFFVDALGRRNSLFIGITIQMLSHTYLGVFIKFHQEGTVSKAASEAALAAVFIHGFGYAVGLLVLPYVFVSELWPNQIRSFGAALTQCFHWLFFFGVNKGFPSLLSSMDNWGAFLFFAGWCALSLIYVFCVVPETAGVPLEKLDELFDGPWWNTWKRSKTAKMEVIESAGIRQDDDNKIARAESGDESLQGKNIATIRDSSA